MTPEISPDVAPSRDKIEFVARQLRSRRLSGYVVDFADEQPKWSLTHADSMALAEDAIRAWESVRNGKI